MIKELQNHRCDFGSLLRGDYRFSSRTVSDGVASHHPVLLHTLRELHLRAVITPLSFIESRLKKHLARLHVTLYLTFDKEAEKSGERYYHIFWCWAGTSRA